MDTGVEIRVSGIVQGVGFRPTVWHLATAAGLTGKVLNNGKGVLIHCWGSDSVIDRFLTDLNTHAPPLARIDRIEQVALDTLPKPEDFTIVSSDTSAVHTGVTPDAATCQACKNDVLDPTNRRYRYAFTNCTHCGPRLSIINAIPYDRENTSMSAFSLCAACATEYHNPADRRFHAQPNACPVCGPELSLERMNEQPIQDKTIIARDAIEEASSLLKQGNILLIKGIGGFHLACDASNTRALELLRARKRRYHKPFALMARNLAAIKNYCTVSDTESALLESTEAPIVLLQIKAKLLPDSVAPGLNTLGFMLPYSPLHLMLLDELQAPIVLTSGNLSDEPQCIDDAEAKERLGGIADYVLAHNRAIVNRIDDSVTRIIADQPRLLRRARGYAPATIPLPQGFENCPDILALGGELKNTFCITQNGDAILSQHMGDLENASCFADLQKNLQLYQELYQHTASAIAIDAHPEYLSSKLGCQFSEHRNIPIHSVQHHHAHIAACLADNNRAIDADDVLGVILDGLGYGNDNSLWGGEFLRANYHRAERLGCFKPVALPGGSQAMHEPWRNTYAHLVSAFEWNKLNSDFEGLDLLHYLESKPLKTIDAMLAQGINCPLASSCGRLFDAVAAALGICRERVSYEGQAAIELEALVDLDALSREEDKYAYPFDIVNIDNKLPTIDPLPMWRALLSDLQSNTPAALIAARFHKGLAIIIVTMTKLLADSDERGGLNTVALSGGVFQNRILLEQVVMRLEGETYEVLTHHRVPANDGGLALGQALIAAACSIKQQG